MEDNKISENPENNENMEKTENAEELNAELEALAELFRDQSDQSGDGSVIDN